MGSKRYEVVFEQGESGVWTATIDRSQGVSCTTQAATREEAAVRIREALALYLDDERAAAEAELVEG